MEGEIAVHWFGSRPQTRMNAACASNCHMERNAQENYRVIRSEEQARQGQMGASQVKGMAVTAWRMDEKSGVRRAVLV